MKEQDDEIRKLENIINLLKDKRDYPIHNWINRNDTQLLKDLAEKR